MLSHKDLGFIIKVQTVVSALLALLVVGSVVWVAMWNMMGVGSVEIPPVFVDWGGVIIGFYFGTFLTQMGNIAGRGD